MQSSLYADVDENGNLIFGDYLKKVELSLDQTTVAVGDPAAVTSKGCSIPEKPADLSQAVVEYRFSDDAPVAKLESADVIYMPKAIPMSEQVS